MRDFETHGSGFTVSCVYVQKKRRRVWSECEECGRRFSRMSLLKAHRQTHVAESAAVDTLCPSSPPSSNTLALRCSQCGKRFSSATRLHSHIRTQHWICWDGSPGLHWEQKEDHRDLSCKAGPTDHNQRPWTSSWRQICWNLFPQQTTQTVHRSLRGADWHTTMLLLWKRTGGGLPVRTSTWDSFFSFQTKRDAVLTESGHVT